MDRVEILTAFREIENVEEIVVPKRPNASRFDIDDDGLYWHTSVDDRDFKLGRDQAIEALRHVPGLSSAAIKEWPVELLLEPLNWWYEHGDGDVRVLVNDSEVVSFPKRTVPGLYSPTRMLESVEEGLEAKHVPLDSLHYDKVHVGLDRVSFAVVTTERRDEVKVGDYVDGGIMVFGSPTGAAHIELSPYLNRLVCTNGMISPVAMGRWSHAGGEDENVYDWTKALTEQAWDDLDAEVEALRELTQVPVDDHVHLVLADLFDRHRVPVSLREPILEAAVEEADGTMFGIAQAFNRVANDVDNVATMRHLLMVTGEVAHQTERCSACLRALN